MAKAIFKSKSASKARKNDIPAINVTAPPKTIVVDRVMKDVIFWYGSVSQAHTYGKKLSYDIRKLEELFRDTSLVVHAKCLIFYNAVLGLRTIKIISFAVNYGIPVMWYHPHITPHKWMWSFRYVMVGEEKINNFWKEVCLII